MQRNESHLTNLHRIDPCTIFFFILNNEAIWIQTTAKHLRHFSTFNPFKPLISLSFQPRMTLSLFAPFYPKCRKIQNIAENHLFLPRLTSSSGVKIGVSHPELTAFRVKMMLSLQTICLFKMLFSALFHPHGHDFSCHFNPLNLLGRHL